jgi:glycosyltransferase involved in cell wall biosynthesis
MKITIISSLYGASGGGAGLIAHHLARGLHDMGHKISVITLGGRQHYSLIDEGGIRVYRFQPLNLYTLEEKDTHLRWKKIAWQILDVYNLHAARVLQAILQKESPELVHIHKMRGFSGSVWAVAARLLSGRVIQTCHDYESMSPEGLLRGSIGRMALQKKWPIRGYQLIRAKLSKGVSGLTAPSRFTLQRITESGLFPTAQRRVIPNTHGWSHQEMQFINGFEGVVSPNKIRFLFLGRLEEEKGIHKLCEAFLQASDIHPDMELDVAGWGTLESELRAMYGRYHSINFLGMVQGQSKMQALKNATAIIVPSLVDEVFGLVTVEAYAFGKPVIASNLGGLPELVRDGETGWLIDPGDVNLLVQRMLSVAEIDASALAKMNWACKDFSYQFSMEKILAEYLGFYDQLLSKVIP